MHHATSDVTTSDFPLSTRQRRKVRASSSTSVHCADVYVSVLKSVLVDAMNKLGMMSATFSPFTFSNGGDNSLHGLHLSAMDEHRAWERDESCFLAFVCMIIVPLVALSLEVLPSTVRLETLARGRERDWAQGSVLRYFGRDLHVTLYPKIFDNVMNLWVDASWDKLAWSGGTNEFRRLCDHCEEKTTFMPFYGHLFCCMLLIK